MDNQTEKAKKFRATAIQNLTEKVNAQKPPYETLKTVRGVIQSTPQVGKYTRPVEKHSFTTSSGEKVVVEAHYENVIPIQGTKNIFVKRNFFVNQNHLGKEYVFKVVVELRTQKNRQTIILNYTPIYYTGEEYYLVKFPQADKGGIPIPGCSNQVWFKRTSKK